MRPKTAGAIFDVRPVDETGRVDVERTTGLPGSVDLRGVRAARTIKPETENTLLLRRVPAEPAPEPAVPAAAYTKDDILRELQGSLSGETDTKNLLARLGAAVKDHIQPGKPRYRPVLARKNDDRFDYAGILAEIRRPVGASHGAPHPAASRAGHAEPGVEVLTRHDPVQAAAIENWYGVRAQGTAWAKPASAPAVSARRRTVLAATAVFLVLAGIFGLTLMGRVVRDGNAAVQNLQSAKENLEQFDFGAASQNFLLAYEEFSKAAESMNVFGANIGGLLGELPGAGKLKSANNLIEAGKLIAQSGQSMADVVKAVSRTGVVLNPNSNSRVLTAEILTPMKQALQLSGSNLERVSALLAEVDESVIPEEKREMFSELTGKLPEFRELISEGMDYTLFFERFVGADSPRTYLLLFQNSSELRPTGGFPGSYGLFTLEGGRVKSFAADDVYDIDGQLKELYVPPPQLQHITPNWAMRDAGWFIDFPTSARKMMEFYKKETASEVEGVITINPQIMAELLDVVGPVEMPEYGLTLDGGNFLSAVQNEVEYGENKKINQPKKIIVDLAPLFIKKLHSAPRDKWLEIFNVFTAAMERKDLLMYFKDPELERFAVNKGFGGQVVLTGGDYLMVTLSNVKGAKSDAVTETAFKLDSVFSGDGLTHKLTITRRHNGGKTKYGFYNKQNPAYVRVLVPKGSEVVSVSGNSTPGYQPLLNYPKTDYRRDAELEALEQSGRRDSRGVTTYQESGRTGFGFWMVVDPGEIKTVELEYRVPSELARKDYELLIQKQPGLQIGSFDFTAILPQDAVIEDATPVLTGSRGRYGFSAPLDGDTGIRIKLK